VRTVFAALVCVVLLADPAAAQQNNDEATTLFNRALELLDEGRSEEACPLLQQAFEHARGVGIQYQLATCYVAIGRTASAHAHFTEVAEVAARAGQAERAEVARQKAAQLAPKLNRVRFSAPAVEGLVVRIDGDVVEHAQPVPVDPGSHTISATAPSHEPWEQRVEVAGVGHVVPVAIVLVPQLLEVPPPQPDAPMPSPPPPVTRGWGAVHVSGLVIGLLGAAGLGASVAMGVVAKSKDDEAGELCAAPGGCDPVALAINDDARALGTVGTGVFIGGAVLAAGGTTMLVIALLTDDASEEPAMALFITPQVIGAHGSF
jgi:hypothetical protein